MAIINSFPQGIGSGSGLPDGGDEGQVLAKLSSADQDVGWVPSGGVDSIPVMVGATNYTNGYKGLAPQPLTTDVGKFLGWDGKYHTIYTAASGSTILVHTADASLFGRTVSLTDGVTTLTTTMGNDGECQFTDVQMYGGVTITCTDAENNTARASVNLSYFGIYAVNLTLNFSTIRLTATDMDLIGKTIEIYHNNVLVATTTMTQVAPAQTNLVANVYVEELGEYVCKVDAADKGIGQVSVTVAALRQVYIKEIYLYHVYAFKIDKNDSNPATCVTPYMSAWGCENLNYTPAHMDFTNDVFDYGSWAGTEFFFPKPCMLTYSGTVDYYLNQNDYTKKADGTASDVGDFSYNGNAMVQFPTIYFNRWEDANYCYCVISNKKIDTDFYAYAHHDTNGDVLPYIYIACYDGSYDGTRLRSISGKGPSNNDALTSGKIMCKTTRQQEVNFAKANNNGVPSGHEGHYTWHKADLNMIQDLLLLIGMNTNTQATFGRGRDTGYASTSNTGQVTTGSMNTKGMFWGENAGAAGVKVFGIENFWANIWKAVAGWINANGTQKTKMTYGKEDGSNVIGYNFDGANYVSISDATPTGTSGGCINKWKYSKEGFVPYTVSGSDSTYAADGLWFNNSQNNYARAGGNSNGGLLCGALCASLLDAASAAYWAGGAALSYK